VDCEQAHWRREYPKKSASESTWRAEGTHADRICRALFHPSNRGTTRTTLSIRSVENERKRQSACRSHSTQLSCTGDLAVEIKTPNPAHVSSRPLTCHEKLTLAIASAALLVSLISTYVQFFRVTENIAVSKLALAMGLAESKRDYVPDRTRRRDVREGHRITFDSQLLQQIIERLHI
jgi:hypothetical protein